MEPTSIILLKLPSMWKVPCCGHQLLQMSKQFQFHEKSNLTVSTNRDTRDSEIQTVTEHKTLEMVRKYRAGANQERLSMTAQSRRTRT